jgi:hypothetical protein
MSLHWLPVHQLNEAEKLLIEKEIDNPKAID